MLNEYKIETRDNEIIKDLLSHHMFWLILQDIWPNFSIADDMFLHKS